MASFLTRFQADIQHAITLVGRLLDVDVAVFDLDATLTAATENYLRHKGSRVHAPSIEEVVSRTSVLVNKPGRMPSCIGCRFKGNCPAKIEILHSIQANDNPVGAVAFTSFSDDGHDRVSRQTTSYIKALEALTGLFSLMATHQITLPAFPRTMSVVKTLVRSADDMVLLCDASGRVIEGNKPALNLFTFCDLAARSITQLFPGPVTDEILSGRECTFDPIPLNHFHARVSAIPFHDGAVFSGALIRIEIPGKAWRTKPRQPRTASRFTLNSIVGNAPGIQHLKTRIKKLQASCSTLMITGETGTGKGLLAKVVHYTGSRRQGPFVFVNCAGIPESLFESELFGYEEGAFTGARKGGKPGRFELAQGGTLVLDEISEIPLNVQAKLLHVLQEQILERVGGTTSVDLDVRIIATSNQNMSSHIKEHRFRSDLYYRINVVPLKMPALRHRKTDIPVLARYFLDQINAMLGKSIRSISPAVMDRLLAHEWPGNIRELQNVIEYAVNMSDDSDMDLVSLPPDFIRPAKTDDRPGDIKSQVIHAEMAAILSALDTHGWDGKGKKKAAAELGIGLRTLYRKLNQFAGPSSKASDAADGFSRNETVGICRNYRNDPLI